MTTGSQSVLKRKLAAARQGERGPARSALRALRLALARAAASETGLSLAVIGATQSRRARDDLAGALSGDHLHLLLDGSDGRLGGLCLDRACVTALVQQQTTGQVDGGDAAARRFTAADAALAAPLVDAMLARAADLADSAADRTCLAGYRFGARVEDMRALVLALDADRFRVFDLTVEIAAGMAQGRLCLVLPDIAPDAPVEEAGRPLRPGLEQSFGALRAELTAVVGRLRVPLSTLSRMQPGDILPLTRGRLDLTDLVAINGQRVATGRLGQSGGARAVRLADAVVPETLGETALARPRPAAPERQGEPPEPAAAKPGTALTAPRQTGGAEPKPASSEAAEAEDYERHLSSLSAEQAAAEISQLAGLPLDDTGAPEPQEGETRGGPV
ncbi:MAG: FliM/FliN family flagellar motor switch protein [Rhodobacteraceae bacterium]|nr:FliM/FliN family flagellar motor switch protein [Paracoccaceae bacterium]